MKKLFALVLVAVLVISMAPAVLAVDFSASTMKPYADQDWQSDYNPQRNEAFIAIDTPVVATSTAIPTPGAAGYTYKEIKDGKISYELRVTNGQRVVKGVSLEYADTVTVGGVTGLKITDKNLKIAYLKVEFLDKWVSTGDVDYKFMIYQTIDKKRQSATEITIEGNYENNIVDYTLESGDVYVYLGDDVPVVESGAYINNFEIELDGGITVYTRVYNNRKYYGRGEAKVWDSDVATLQLYPSIESVYHIDQVGLNNSYTTVKLDIGDKLFVYAADGDGNLTLLGTANQKLPFSEIYYVSAVELDIATDDVEEPTDDEGFIDEGEDYDAGADAGGDDVPVNVNDNPGTGR